MNKKVAVFVLTVFNILILILALFFIIYSIYFNISIEVLKIKVPGVIFGIMVLYFGIRYFINLIKLKKEIYKPQNTFSWSNFKKTKKRGKIK